MVWETALIDSIRPKELPKGADPYDGTRYGILSSISFSTDQGAILSFHRGPFGAGVESYNLVSIKYSRSDY